MRLLLSLVVHLTNPTSQQPSAIVAHIAPLAATRDVPVCPVPAIDVYLAELLGIHNTLAIAFRSTPTCTDDARERM